MPTATAQRRLSGRDIAAVLQGRQQRAGRYVVAHVRRGAGDGEARIAVVASRRVGNAVARNRAKRVIREAARSLAWRSGTDVVLIARAACATSRMGVVRSELRRLATALDALRDPDVRTEAAMTPLTGAVGAISTSSTSAGRTTHASGELDR